MRPQWATNMTRVLGDKVDAGDYATIFFYSYSTPSVEDAETVSITDHWKVAEPAGRLQASKERSGTVQIPRTPPPPPPRQIAKATDPLCPRPPRQEVGSDEDYWRN